MDEMGCHAMPCSECNLQHHAARPAGMATRTRSGRICTSAAAATTSKIKGKKPNAAVVVVFRPDRHRRLRRHEAARQCSAGAGGGRATRREIRNYGPKAAAPRRNTGIQEGRKDAPPPLSLSDRSDAEDCGRGGRNYSRNFTGALALGMYYTELRKRLCMFAAARQKFLTTTYKYFFSAMYIWDCVCFSLIWSRMRMMMAIQHPT